jgi:hypothetical protein
MTPIKYCLAIALWLLASSAMFAQTTNATALKFVVQPMGTNVILVSASTNLTTVAFSNLAITNTTVDPDPNDPTLTVTNTVITPLFTNLSVTAVFVIGTNTNSLTFLDKGAAPDKKSGDGVYSTNIVIPFTTVEYLLPVNFTIRADDLSSTNSDGSANPVPYLTNFVANYHIVPRPVNDQMTNAFKMTPAGGVATGTNNWASLEPGEPRHAGITNADDSVWWVWSSPVATNVLVDTAGSAFNPALAVYTGTAVNQLTPVASSGDDTANKLKANVSFQAVAGMTYRIAVAGQNTNGVGAIRLRVAPGATPDTRPPLTSITSPNREVFTSSEVIALSGIAKEPTDNDSGISNVFLQVNSLPATNAVGSYPWADWSGTVTLPPGTNIVRAYAVDYAGNVGVADTIVVRYVNPTNDDFASAMVLTGVGGLVTSVNGRATLEPGEPLHAGNLGGHSIWYTWRAPSDGALSLTTAGSTSGTSTNGTPLDTLLDVFVGTNLSHLILVGYNDDADAVSKYSALTVNVISNQAYCIAVDGFGGDSGTVQLQYSFVAPKPGQYYNLRVTALPGGTVVPGSGVYASGARVQVVATAKPQFVFSGWEGDIVTAENPLTVTMTSDVSLTARFRNSSTTGITNKVSDDFESGDFSRLNWVTPVTQGWHVQTNVVQTNANLGGQYAVRSGAITNKESSSLSLTANMVDGVGSFDLRVSSEEGWDYLEFRLNGTLVQRWSGDQPWTNFVFDVKAGTNTLEWKYTKDNSFSDGLDAAFIDNVYVPLISQSGAGAAARLAITRLADGQAQITVQGAPSRSYSIEVTSDMVFWFPLALKDSGTGIIQYLDADAPNYEVRFYRAIAQ